MPDRPPVLISRLGLEFVAQADLDSPERLVGRVQVPLGGGGLVAGIAVTVAGEGVGRGGRHRRTRGVGAGNADHPVGVRILVDHAPAVVDEVQQVLDSAGITVTSFARFKVGA